MDHALVLRVIGHELVLFLFLTTLSFRHVLSLMLFNVLLGAFGSESHKKAVIWVGIFRKFYHLVDAGEVSKNSLAAAQL